MSAGTDGSTGSRRRRRWAGKERGSDRAHAPPDQNNNNRVEGSWLADERAAALAPRLTVLAEACALGAHSAPLRSRQVIGGEPVDGCRARALGQVTPGKQRSRRTVSQPRVARTSPRSGAPTILRRGLDLTRPAEERNYTETTSRGRRSERRRRVARLAFKSLE